jgi:hypothetical protein
MKSVFGLAFIPEDGKFGKYISVFFDRVERNSWEKLRGAAQGVFALNPSIHVCNGLTLGTVIAHEIGHLLLGSNSHSSLGIMQLRWDRQDLEDAYCGRMAFTRPQTKALRENIIARRGGGQPEAALARSQRLPEVE